MADPDLDLLQTAIKRRWSWVPSKKAKGYVNAFFAAEQRGTKITAKVVGNHGTYTVSIQVDERGLRSACRCYIGRHGLTNSFSLALFSNRAARSKYALFGLAVGI